MLSTVYVVEVEYDVFKHVSGQRSYVETLVEHVKLPDEFSVL